MKVRASRGEVERGEKRSDCTCPNSTGGGRSLSGSGVRVSGEKEEKRGEHRKCLRMVLRTITAVPAEAFEKLL